MPIKWISVCPDCESRNAAPCKDRWGRERATCPDCGWFGDEGDMIEMEVEP